MEELNGSTVNTIQYIIVKMGDEQFGIDIKYIDNIVRMQHITRVPKVAPYLKGVINLRGEVIPVISMRLKIGMEQDEYTKDTRIIIVKQEQFGTVGIVVDAVKEVIMLEEDKIEKVVKAKEDHSNFLLGVGQFGDGLISVLDLNALLAEQTA